MFNYVALLTMPYVSVPSTATGTDIFFISCYFCSSEVLPVL